MIKTHKYRLYPNRAQEECFSQTINICRNLYNSCLAEKINYYRTTGVGLNLTRQEAQLARSKPQNSALTAVHSQVLQDVLIRVKHTYNNFFRRVKENKAGKRKQKPGFPRFKSYQRYHSFTYPQQPGFYITNDGKYLHLSKIGNVRIKLHRPVDGIIKSCIIKRNVDQWYACVQVEVKTPAVVDNFANPIGLDMGLSSFVTLSNGSTIDNPRYLRKSEKQLKKAQRRLSKRKKGSKNRNKQRIKVAKLHRKIANQRNDFLHQVSCRIVGTFSFAASERLNIKNMVGNHNLAKSIIDASWGRFLNYISYKAAEAGKRYVQVLSYGTTTECSRCGAHNPITLSERIYRCSSCGIVLPRDTNSALVVLKRALNTAGTAGIHAWGDLAPTLPPKVVQAGSLSQEAPPFRAG